jgi:hypothetical protein
MGDHLLRLYNLQWSGNLFFERVYDEHRLNSELNLGAHHCNAGLSYAVTWTTHKKREVQLASYDSIPASCGSGNYIAEQFSNLVKVASSNQFFVIKVGILLNSLSNYASIMKHTRAINSDVPCSLQYSQFIKRCNSDYNLYHKGMLNYRAFGPSLPQYQHFLQPKCLFLNML